MEIRANGNIVLGARIPGTDGSAALIGPNGVAYGSSIVEAERTGASNASSSRSTPTACGRAGRSSSMEVPSRTRRSVRTASSSSRPGFDEGSRIARLNPDGSEAAPRTTSRSQPNGRPTATGHWRHWPTIAGDVWVVADGAILGFDRCQRGATGLPVRPRDGPACCRTRTADLGIRAASRGSKPPRLAPQEPHLHAGNRPGRGAGASPLSIATAASAPAGRRPFRGRARPGRA